MEPYGLSLLDKYPDAWRIFFQVFLASTVLISFLYFIAKRTGLMMPAIRERDVHTKPKPRVGGLAMWVVAFVSIIVIAASPSTAHLLDFQGPKLFGLDQVLWGILVALVIILVFGLLDDLYSLRPRTQLLGQFLAATVLILSGLEVPYIRLPYEGILHLNTAILHLPDWLGGNLSIWSALFVYIWVITMINVVNFFDGLDGLAGSVSMTSALVLLLVSLRIDFIGAATLCLILFGTTAGFLPWNWHPSKLIMGTIGSQLLGLLLAIIAIISGAKVATAVLVLGIPIFDAFVVIVRRLRAKQSPFVADQRHLHHRLMKVGLPIPWLVILVNVIVLTFGILALRTQQTNAKGLLTVILALCMFAFIWITYLLERRALKK